MYTLIIIFIIMALIVGLFSMFLVGRDFVNEEKAKKAQKEDSALVAESVAAAPVSTPAPAPMPIAVVEPTAAQEAEETAEEEQEETAEDIPQETQEAAQENAQNTEGMIAFNAKGLTLEEKYLELSSEYKAYYDEIVRTAMAVEGSKRYKNAAYEDYKIGNNKLVRLKIRRGVVICELVVQNLAFKTYINDNKVAMKQAPASIKVVDEESLNAVKDGIGIAVKAIEEEKAYKKEQLKARRKEKREKEKEQEKAASEEVNA